MKKSSIFAVLCAVLALAPFSAQAGDFQAWLSDLRKEAARQGISQATINKALSNVTPIARVIELDRKQPEGQLTFAQYRTNIVSPARIEKGRALYRQHYDMLHSIGKKYGVQPEYIVALWGIETNYGGFTGGMKTIDALATLAHDGRRSAFFRKELINALTIIDQGHIDAGDMKGSWAGALGQNQFMPSSFLTYAVDENGDGKKDIWHTHLDIFASSANYLSRSGWHADERWGREVRFPKGGIPADLIDIKVEKPLSYWRQAGLKTMTGQPIPVIQGMKASLIQPDGPHKSAYLVYNNYKTLLKWNRSIYFATSVGLLADSIAAP